MSQVDILLSAFVVYFETKKARNGWRFDERPSCAGPWRDRLLIRWNLRIQDCRTHRRGKMLPRLLSKVNQGLQDQSRSQGTNMLSSQKFWY